MNWLDALRPKLQWQFLFPGKMAVAGSLKAGRYDFEPRTGFSKDSALWIAMALALVVATTVGLLAFSYFYPLERVAIVYVIPVLIAATRWGLVPGIAAALAGAATIDFFFYPPIYSLYIIDNPQDIVELVLFVFVTLVASNLAERLRMEAQALRRREDEMRTLYEFSRRLAVCSTTRDINLAVQWFVAANLQYPLLLVISGASRGSALEVIGPKPIPAAVFSKAQTVMAEHLPSACTIIESETSEAWLIKPMATQIEDFGVAAVALGKGSSSSIEYIGQQVEAELDRALASLLQLDIARAITQARMRAYAEQFREALVGSVSHELRSPLTSILGFVGLLAQEASALASPRLSSLAQSIHGEAKRLDTDIGKLLDATRLSNETVQPRMEWHDPVDIINGALRQKKQSLSDHHLEIDLPGDLPIVKVDAVLLERSLAELLENAAKYSPKGSAINLSAVVERQRIVFRVRDSGIGLTSDELGKLGNRSFRGRRRNALPGSGLGLWIANAFVAANGGTIFAESEGPDLGVTISIVLPRLKEICCGDEASING